MDESFRQASNVTPPTSSGTPGEGVTAIATTTSASTVDLWGGNAKPLNNPGYFDRYITIMACGADCYFLFSAASNVTIDNTIDEATVSAGTTVAVPFLLKDGVPQSFRLNEDDHRYLNLKAATGTPIVRITPSSQKLASRH